MEVQSGIIQDAPGSLVRTKLDAHGIRWICLRHGSEKQLEGTPINRIAFPRLSLQKTVARGGRVFATHLDAIAAQRWNRIGHHAR